MSVTISDVLFGFGAFAVLTVGWERNPPFERAAQAPLARLSLTEVAEHYVKGNECSVSGTMENIGSAPVPKASFRLVVEAPEGRVVAGAMNIENLGIGDASGFALPYKCELGIGRWNYRAFVNDVPVPVLQMPARSRPKDHKLRPG